MNQYEKTQVALHAPNIVNICIDAYDAGEMSGRIYHCYDEEALLFTNIIKLIEQMEYLFDEIGFPQASEQRRVFIKKEQHKKEVAEKLSSPQDVAAHRGRMGSFLTQVKYRQNSSWQGAVEWMETGNRQKFVSVLEWLKILNNALEGGDIQ